MLVFWATRGAEKVESWNAQAKVQRRTKDTAPRTRARGNESALIVAPEHGDGPRKAEGHILPVLIEPVLTGPSPRKQFFLWLKTLFLREFTIGITRRTTYGGWR